MLTLIFTELFIFSLFFYINLNILLTRKLSLHNITLFNILLALLFISLSYNPIHICSIILIVLYNIMNNYHIYYIVCKSITN
jgi:hypothetical protein